MVIKGTSCAGARRLAVHLTRTDTNERAEVREIRGVAADDLRGALLEMEAVAAGSRSKKPFYHASINTRADERLTERQRMQAIDRLETALGLTGQPRVVVVHEKEGREHCHIVWSRIYAERMTAISDSHNYRKHEQVARDLEREFGHERVQGAHVEREGKERPKRTPSHAEMLQADRTGMKPQEAKERITEIWQRTDSGQAFAVALWHEGFVLARGDRRDFVVIDPKGGTHSLSRRVEGMKAKDIRDRLADLDPGRLPNVIEAKQIQRVRQARDAKRVEGEPTQVANQTLRDTPQVEPRSENTVSHSAAAKSAGKGISVAFAKVASGLASLAENLLGGAPEPPPPPAPHEIAAAEERAAEAEREAQRETVVKQTEADKDARRQALFLQYGRETEEGLGRDPERDKGRERTRG